MGPVLGTGAEALARDFKIVNGQLSMPSATLKKWRQAHVSLTGPQRKARRVELIAMTVAFTKFGEPATKAIAQLAILIQDLLREPKASPRAKSWGSK